MQYPISTLSLQLLQEENEVISTLTGFSLDHVLTDLDLPTGSALSNQLGLATNRSLNLSQIYGENWNDEEAVGPGQGQDWEDEVDRELKDGALDENVIKAETQSPPATRERERRVRIVKRLVERPKTVYERFPAFEKDKVLDFTELFKGFTVTKSRLSKKPFHSALVWAERIREKSLIPNHSRIGLSTKERGAKRIP